MFFTKIKRVVRSGFFNFWRNSFVSLSAILVMVVTLAVIGSVVFGSAVLNSSLLAIKNKVDVNAYFVNNAPEAEILALKKSLEALPEVAEVTYISQEEVLKNFKEKHQNDELIMQGLDELGTNPLSASFNIRAKNPSEYAGIAEFLKQDTLISSDGELLLKKVDFNEGKKKAAIDNLTKIINSSEKLGLVLSVILILISILITFNTIRLIIFVSREEISVMRLVGASAFYVRGPFIVSGVIYGIASGLLTLAVFYPITYWLGQATENFFIGLNMFEYYLQNFGQMFLIIVGSGIIIGAISSYLAVRKYLKH